MKRLLSIWLCMALVVLATGCASVAPPIQEMSDARLAIAAAIDAGAEKFASDVLDEARVSLRSAESNLTRKAYSAARRDAGLAKSMATSARETAESKRGKPDRMTEQPLK